MPSDLDTEFAVVGGGPTGLAAALRLAQYGRAVVVLERGEFRARRIGEIFSPRIRGSLHALGLDPDLILRPHLKNTGTISFWDTTEATEHDYVRFPYGSAWNVDRVRFDRDLAAHARAAGAVILENAAVLNCSFARGSCVVRFRRAGEEHAITSDYVLFAQGHVAGTLGVPATKHLRNRLVALVAWPQSVCAESHEDTRLLLERCPVEWWYSAPMPNGQSAFGLVTDGATIRDCGSVNHAWQRGCDTAPSTLQRLSRFQTILRIQSMPIESFVRHPIIGERYAYIGAAAVSFDPLFGNGVCMAIDSANLVSKLLRRITSEIPEAMKMQYKLWIGDKFEMYMRIRSIQYEIASPETPSLFWCNRKLRC